MTGPHLTLDDGLRDDIVRHVLSLGTGTVAEAAAFASHLDECATCRTEAEQTKLLATRLLLAAKERAPTPDLRLRVLERIRGDGRRPASARGDTSIQPWRRWQHDALLEGLSFVGADTNAFEPTGTPGIVARRLSVNAAGNRVTMLVRMEPGASYPAHRHGGDEECFVVEGDLHVGSVHMHVGDYQRAPKDSIHPVQITERGCTLLLVSAMNDEILG